MEYNFDDRVSVALAPLRTKSGHWYNMLSTFVHKIENKTIDEPIRTRFNSSTALIRMDINTDMVDIEDEEFPSMIMHELLHVILGHHTRPIIKEMNLLNQGVTDSILDSHINGILKDIGLNPQGTMFDDLLHSTPKIADWYDENKEEVAALGTYGAVEQYFEELRPIYRLIEQEEQQQNDGGDGDGDNPEDSDAESKGGDGNSPSNYKGNHSFKDEIGEDSDEEVEDKLSNGTIEAMMKQIAESTRSVGSSADMFARMMSAMRKKKRVVRLPALMTGVNAANAASDDSSYMSFNNTSLSAGYRKKGQVQEESHTAVCAIDVSGSVTEEDIAQIIAVMRKVDCDEIDIIFWSCEDKIYEQNVYKEFNPSKDAIPKPYSEGGTDITALTKYINEKYKKNTMMFLFTDLYYDYVPFSENVSGLYIGVLNQVPEGQEFNNEFDNSQNKMIGYYKEWNKKTKGKFFKASNIYAMK